MSWRSECKPGNVSLLHVGHGKNECPFSFSHLLTASTVVGKVLSVKVPYACLTEPRVDRFAPVCVSFHLVVLQ